MKKDLRRESVTHENVSPNSTLGKAIISGDKKTIRKIERASREDAADRKAIEQWASRDFESGYETWGLTGYAEGSSLESEDGEE